MEGSASRWKLFQTGKYDIAASVSTDAVMALEGVGGHAERGVGPRPVRVFWRIINFTKAIGVRGDSPIKSAEDIKPGVRYCYDAGSPSGMQVAEAMRAWMGLEPDEMELVPSADNALCVDCILEGKADMMLLNPTSSFSYKFASSPKGVRVLDMDPVKYPENAKRMSEVMPSWMFLPCTVGIEEAHGIVMPVSLYIYQVLPGFDEELAYHLAEWLDKNFDAYKEKDIRVADMGIEPFAECLKGFYIPAHEGVIKYMKEEGLWTSSCESSWNSSLDQVNRYADAFEAAVAKADKSGISVDPSNEEWLDFWENYKKELGLQSFKQWS